MDECQLLGSGAGVDYNWENGGATRGKSLWTLDILPTCLKVIKLPQEMFGRRREEPRTMAQQPPANQRCPQPTSVGYLHNLFFLRLTLKREGYIRRNPGACTYGTLVL